MDDIHLHNQRILDEAAAELGRHGQRSGALRGTGCICGWVDVGDSNQREVQRHIANAVIEAYLDALTQEILRVALEEGRL